MTTPVDAVLFDVDDTICSYTQRGADVLSRAFEAASVEPFFTVEEYVERYGEYVDESDGVRDLRERCFATLAREAGYGSDFGREIARVYAAERDHSQVRFREGARETIDSLAERYPLGIVTNGAPEMQATKLETLGVDEHFETVVHAGYDAPAKPHPDPFHAALDRLGAEPGRAIHVGNSLESDVAGAHAAGLQSAWLENGEAEPEPEPHYVLDSLRDLTEPPWA